MYSILLLQASSETIEAEFWKVVEEADEPVEVLYGADIDTTITGSGFPQKVCATCLLYAFYCSDLDLTSSVQDFIQS